MAEESRSFLAKLGLNTKDFSKGVNEAKAKLTELNAEFYKNKREQKALQEQLKELEKEKKNNKRTTEEEQKAYEELIKKVDKATIELAELQTQEAMLRNEANETKKALKEQANASDDSSEAWQNVGKVVKNAAQFTATAVAGMFTYTTQITATAGEIDDLAKQTGLTVEEVQKLMYAAELSGTSYDTITSAMAKLVKNMSTAQKGTGDAAEAFKALEVDVENSSGVLRDNQDVFNEVIQKLGTIEDVTQRDAYAMAIFGKSAQDLNPLILGGTEQLKSFGDELEREGLLLSQAELDKLNEFDDKWVQFQSKLQAGLMGTGSEAVDAFEELFEMSDEIVDLVANLVTGFAKLSGFTVEHKEAVLALVAAYGVYKTALSISNIMSSVVTITKSLTGATKKATDAQEGMNKAVKVNPYVLLATALLAVYVSLGSLAKSAWETESNLSGMVGATDELRNSISDIVSEAQKEVDQLNAKAERYEELRTKINRTAAEEQELYNIAAELEAAYPNQIELIGDTAGAYMELGNQAEITGQKMLEAAEKEAAANALAEAYENRSTAKARMEAIYSEITSSKRVSSTVFDDDGTLETRIDGTWKVRNIGDAQGWLLGDDGKKLAELTAEYNELNGEMSLNDRLISELESAYSGLANATNENIAISSEQQETLTSFGEITDTVTEAQNEYTSSNELSKETLDALVANYPELQDEINDYISGLGTVESVINALNVAYQNDVKKYNEAIKAKMYTDEEYFSKLQGENKSAISALAEKYGVDISNYETYAEAKLAIEREFLTKKAGYWEKYYSLEQGKMKINLKDITIEQLRLVNEEGYTPEQAMAATKQMQEEYTYVYSELLPGLHDLSASLNTDITDYSEQYKSTLTNSSTTSGGTTSSTAKEISIYEQAGEAFKQITEERIADIQRLTDAENSAADKRIAAIKKEIAAKEKLKEENDLQEQIDYVNAQLKYSQLENFERLELERKLKELKDEQSEQAWLDSKNAEMEALEAQKKARDKETAALVEQLKANREYASRLFQDLNNGYQSTSSIVNNNSRQDNVTIITEALSMGQVKQVVKEALGLELII